MCISIKPGMNFTEWIIISAPRFLGLRETLARIAGGGAVKVGSGERNNPEFVSKLTGLERLGDV